MYSQPTAIVAIDDEWKNKNKNFLGPKQLETTGANSIKRGTLSQNNPGPHFKNDFKNLILWFLGVEEDVIGFKKKKNHLIPSIFFVFSLFYNNRSDDDAGKVRKTC
jgi:hypothetical protein